MEFDAGVFPQKLAGGTTLKVETHEVRPPRASSSFAGRDQRSDGDAEEGGGYDRKRPTDPPVRPSRGRRSHRNSR